MLVVAHFNPSIGAPMSRSIVFAFGFSFIALSSGALAQQFIHNTADVPPSGNRTENVDFGDVDLDGDWDALFGNGGDFGNEQDILWRNNGGAQGGTVGVFTNVTATQLPAILDQTRDVEFVDFDNDGDIDVYISNTSQITNQSNRWWRNTGPGAGVGFYVDESAARWSGLGAAGSSIPPSFVLGGGGFIDWSCDCDFADLDNDGDMDLLHSSYGGAFGGQVPTRLFLNDGTGVFSEFNPSGFQLPGQNISNGNPGIWCQGAQSANTTNATGANCDIASTPLDIQAGDIDGDLDIDILHGARQELPRMFVNRLQEEGSLAFRDVTGSAFPPGYSTGGGHYEEEMGDFDNDGDWDIYGLNWLSLTDNVMHNSGNGVYTNVVALPGSSSDDNEGDFIDYNNDGDLDIFVANFSGQERLYDNNGAGSFSLSAGTLPGDGTTSLDADVCDVDNDGDTDVFVANDGSQAEWYLQNTTSANDTFAPRITNLEQAPNRTAGPAPTVIRAQVGSNTNYYITWYHPTALKYTVNGGPVQTVPMQSSQAQIFRGLIPGNLVGTIAYRVESSDQYGNTGVSVEKTFTSNDPTSFCSGDGSLPTPCPCVPPNTVPNPSGDSGHGCANSFDLGGALLSASGTTSPDTIQFTCVVGGNYAAFALMLKGDAVNLNGTANADGVLCVSGALLRFGAHYAATGGAPPGSWTLPNALMPNPISVASAQAPGQTAYYQLFFRNAAPNFCTSATANWSNGVQLAWPP
jgi:hypothetical protein